MHTPMAGPPNACRVVDICQPREQCPRSGLPGSLVTGSRLHSKKGFLLISVTLFLTIPSSGGTHHLSLFLIPHPTNSPHRSAKLGVCSQGVGIQTTIPCPRNDDHTRRACRDCQDKSRTNAAGRRRDGSGPHISMVPAISACSLSPLACNASQLVTSCH